MDLNSDGHPDILSGSYSRLDNKTMAGLFYVLWGQPDGTFKKPVPLEGTDHQPLIIPSDNGELSMASVCTRPTAVDWNADGKLDLVVGSFDGRFYLFMGEGQGKFSPVARQILAGDEVLQLNQTRRMLPNGTMNVPIVMPGHHGDPFFADWDGDGDLDMLSGSDAGGVQWAENIAGPGKPIRLKPFTWLIPPPAEQRDQCQPAEYTEPAGRTRVWAYDMNGDGKLDILVGDSITLISPANGLSQQEFFRQREKWTADLNALYHEMYGSREDSKKKTERLRAHYQRRKEFMTEDQTGFVWVYLRK